MPQLKTCLETYFPRIDLVLCRFHRYRSPEVVLHNLSQKQEAATLHPYCSGMYQLDPFYQHWLGRPTAGVFRLDEIAPSEFRRTEYFLTYYTGLGLHDELMCFVSSSADTTLAFSFGFYQPPPERDGDLLSDKMTYLFPLLQALLEKHHWQASASLLNDAVASSGVFVDERLSDREQEVARLFLQGHSAAAIADQLCISPGTVKNHRKNIYAKLGINSQAELFQRFLHQLGVD
ncbi:helix-turn-helix transcriptional regulator [Oceanisphaera sediminis]|uniref:helix-turn-helix transcriptional regulator n=1 Tax=Oceanisphaera sediminis TaxID=981381 RepID=UPI0031E6AEFF